MGGCYSVSSFFSKWLAGRNTAAAAAAPPAPAADAAAATAAAPAPADAAPAAAAVAAPAAADARAGRWVPRHVVRHPPRVAPPFTLGEDVFALPPGTLKEVLKCFKLCDTCELRLVCRDAEAHVAEHAWADADTPIASLARWRAAFPRAVAAKLSDRVAWKPGDMNYLAGLRELNVGDCTLPPSAFTQLARLSIARVRGCNASVLQVLLLDADMPQSIAAAAAAAAAAVNTSRWLHMPDGSIEALVTALTEHQQQPRACEAACLALSFYCRFFTTRCQTFLELGGLEATAAVMQRHAGSAGVATAGLAVLRSVAQGAAFIERINTHNSNAIVAALTAMRTFSTDAFVAEAGCLLLSTYWLVAGLPSEQISLCRLLVAAASRDHVGNPAVCIAACGALRTLVCASGVQLEGHGIPLIVDAIRTHRNHKRVTKAGMEALAQIFWRRDNPTGATLVSATDVLLDALRESKDDEDMLNSVCDALCYFLWESPSHPPPSCGQMFVDAGAHLTLFAALVRHKASDTTCSSICRVLSSLSSSPAAHAMVKAGAIPAVVAAAAAHRSFLYGEVTFLSRLAQNYPCYGSAIIDAGGHAVLLSAVQPHPYRAWDALKHLAAASRDCADAVAAAGGFEAAVAFLRLSRDWWDKVSACNALYVMLQGADGAHVPRALQAGVIEAVLSELREERAHESNRQKWRQQLQILCRTFPAVSEAVARGGGLDGL